MGEPNNIVDVPIQTALCHPVVYDKMPPFKMWVSQRFSIWVWLIFKINVN